MTDRLIRDKTDLRQWCEYLAKRKLPMRVSAIAGKPRSTDQNRLQRLWARQVAEYFGDRTAEEVRGYGKLHFGVPILRAEDEEFAERYDAVIRPLPYESKLAIMMEPLDLPVTRRMNTSQKTRFLDAFFYHWTAEGVPLIEPDDKRYGPKEREYAE